MFVESSVEAVANIYIAPQITVVNATELVSAFSGRGTLLS
jgi:hypothetical protein